LSITTCILHHHIGTESSFERGLAVASDPEVYERQVAQLALDYDIIDLERLLHGPLPKRPLLMTFDDAYRSVLDAVETVLAPMGLPSVFFINPSLLKENVVSFDNTLAWATNTVGLEKLCAEIGVPIAESVGALITQTLNDRNATERAAIKDQVLRAFGPPDLSPRAPLLRPADLPRLVDLKVEIGNHTMTHISGRALKAEEMEREITTAKTELETLSGSRVRSFSVPYGHERDLTPELTNFLRDTGHVAIFLVHARANNHRPAPDVWYRTSLHNEDPGTLKTSLRLKPILRSFKHRFLG